MIINSQSLSLFEITFSSCLKLTRFTIISNIIILLFLSSFVILFNILVFWIPLFLVRSQRCFCYILLYVIYQIHLKISITTQYISKDQWFFPFLLNLSFLLVFQLIYFLFLCLQVSWFLLLPTLLLISSVKIFHF